MAQYTVRVELGTEKIIFKISPQGRVSVTADARGCHPRVLGHDGHKLARTHQAIFGNPVAGLGIHAAFGPVHQGIAQASLRIGEVGFGADGLRCFGESQLDGIVHASCRNPFQPRSVGAETPDAARTPLHPFAFFGRNVETRAGTGHIEPAVGRGKGANDAVGVDVQHPARQNHLAFVGHAVVIGIRKFD